MTVTSTRSDVFSWLKNALVFIKNKLELESLISFNAYNGKIQLKIHSIQLKTNKPVEFDCEKANI